MIENDNRTAAMGAGSRTDELHAKLVDLCQRQISANKKDQTMLEWVDEATPQRFLDVLLARPTASGAAALSGPVLYQYRMRADWHKNWSAWETCSDGQYSDYVKCPLLNDWHYEARALCVCAATGEKGGA